MADENIVTNIVANADFSNLIADVNRVSASLSKLQAQIIASDAKLANQVAVMNRSFAENLRRTGQFSTHFVTLTSDVEKFGKNLDTGKLKLRDYFRTFQDHTRTSGGLIRDLAKQQVALQNAIIQPLGKNAQGMMQYNVHIPQGLDAIKNKTSLARQELQIMNKVIQDGGVQLINWGKNTQWAGRQLTVGLTVPLVALGAAAAKSFREADAELTRLTKVYGGVAASSSADLAKIRNEVSATARELAKAYGTSFKETIQLAADVAATGKTGNDLINSVKETTRLAVLGEVDRQDAMKATLAIQTAFKQNTEQLSESINFLNSVENQTSTSLADLIEAIPKAGPVVQGLGGSVKDLALYMTAMKEGGINASEGANALKSALASLINPTKVAQEQFAGMGISLKNIVNDNAGDLTGMILELQTALDSLNPLQKQQAIEQLFGKFQFARMNALFENLGKQGSQTLQVMDLMKASSQDLANVANRELSLVTESASGKYKRAVESLKASLAGIGEEFLKVQTFFINVTDSVVKFVNNLPGPVKTILTFVTGLTAVMGPIIMLTGVLANFFGYIIKGASHFRALFKGGEGWKMLTPEILAAQKAGSLVEATFYSDAKAATVLKNAIDGLIAEFTILEQKAKSGAISVAPAFTTMAGSLVAGGGRQVNPNHPLLSPTDTRSMSHMNPVAGMTAEQKAAQTIFGVVPGAPKVNQKISNNPQMYMSGDMPQVEGLTSIKGTSTGVVAAEAAKWHAMTGALAMQSEAEIKALKTEVSRTGLITRELSDSYEALLPTMTDLTANAAKQSAAIVAELQAGTIQVDQARAKIMALNAQVERMIADAAVDIAGQQGRSINLTSVPLLNQPVVDASGKSNMKELSRPGRTRGLLNRIAGGLGVKTFGAPYSIETTMPKRMATGGPVYLAGGGPSGTDTVPAWLTEGEYVLRKAAVDKLGVPLLDKLNDLGISSSSKTVGAHASMPMEYRAHELLSDFGPHLPKGTESFAKALPDHKVDVIDSNKLGLYNEENQALRMGKRGLTRSELIRALAARNAKLFKYLPPMDKETQKVFKRRLLDAAKGLQDGRVYHDDALAQIYDMARKDTMRSLPAELKPGFRQAMVLANTPSGFRPHSFDQYTDGQKPPTMNAAEAKAASGDKPFIYTSPTSAAGKKGKTTAVVTGYDGSKQSITTGGTKMFKKSIRAEGSSWLGRFMPVGRQRVSTDYNSAMLTKKWRGGSRFATGGYVGKGGPQGYANGGMVLDGYADGGPVKGYAGGGLVAGLLAAMGIPMLGNMLGNKVGGTTGSAIANVSNILPFLLPMGAMGGMTKGITSKLPQGATSTVKPLAQTSANLTAMGKAGSSAGAVMSKLGPIFGRVLASVTPLGLAITGVTTALTVGFTIYKKHQEYLKLNALGYGLTAEAAQKAGLKYVDYNQKIKDSIQRSKDMMEANKLAYESMTQAGIPIKMTITEYKKLKDEVKGAYSEQIKLINSTDKAELGDVAVRLKTQLMAAGVSAEESTKKIYAMMSLSKNAGMAAASTVGNKDFNAITDAKTAAGGSLKSFDTAVRLGEAQAQAAALNTSLTAIDAGVDEIVRKSEEAARKDKTNKTEAISKIQAEVKMMEYLNASQFRQTKLTKDTINEMAKANPAIKELASTSDTVVSVWQKLRLQAMGLAGDLSKLNAEQTAALYNIGNIISEKVIASNKGKGGLLEQEYKDLGKYQKQRDDLAKKAAGQSVQAQIDSKKRLKELQDQIDKTNKLADARIKALNAAKEDADLNREMESAKLELQFAESTGNTQQAAQARLRYEGAVNNLQNLGQTRAIQAAADKANAGPLAEIAKIQSANEKLADAAALAGTGLSALDKKIAGLIGTIDGLNNAQSAYQLNLAKWKTENPGMTETDFLKTELGKYLSAGLVAPTKAAGANLPAANGAFPGAKGWVPATTPGASAAAMSSKAFTTDTFIVGDKNLATVLDKAFNGGGKLPGTPTTIPKTPAAGQYGGGTYVSLSQLQKSGAQKKFAGPSDRTGTYVGSTFTDEKGQKWKVTADAGYAGFAVTKAGKGLMDVDPNKPIIVGDMGPELLYNNMVIPNLSSIPFASPSFNIPAGAKALTGLTPGSSNSESTIVYQTFNQAPGEDADAFIRKVTQATVQAIGKDAKLIKSQSGESRSI